MTEEELPEGTSEKIRTFENHLEKIEHAWKLVKRIDLKSAETQLAPVENARLNFTLAYSLNSLFHSAYSCPCCDIFIVYFIRCSTDCLLSGIL